jgi:hypothetical protein
LRTTILLLLGAGALAASSPATWELSSFTEFVKGRFQNVALSRGGQLTLAQKFEPIFTTAEPYLWSVAQSPDGSIYAGTGNRGQLHRIESSGKSTLVWTAPQPEIFALAVDAKGVVYAGTSPNGKIYRVENGRATEYFDPKSTYIWAIAFGPDGALYAGTGAEGKVFRITSAGQGEPYYATGQANVTGLSFDREGRLLAGTEPNGILYRITAKDKAFVLYDANLPEIRAIALDPDGSIYAVGLGGSVAARSSSAMQNSTNSPVTGIPSVSTSITVTAESAQSGGEVKPPAAPDPSKTAASAAAAATAAQTQAATSTAVDLTGVEKSAIYKIHPDSTVETLWSSKEENVYDLLSLNGELIFGTDVNGRIYRFTADRKLSLLEQTNDTTVTRLFRLGSSTLASTGGRARIYRMENSPATSGSYESPVYDAGSVARWGHLNSIGNGTVKILTRSGNSLRPDRTWSDWTAPAPAVTSPNARYLQWKAEFSNAGSSLDSVSIAFLPQNNPPAVRSVTILSAAQPVPATAKPNSGTTAAYSITVTDTGDAGPATSSGTQIQTITRASSQNLIVTWQADDPDGDKLVFSLFFRGEGEHEWKPLKTNLHENSFTIDGDALADGRYSFRVVASDREVNTPGLEAELISSPVLIDNTPPVITSSPLQGSAIDFEVTDSASALKRCEYSIDAGPWIPIAPASGFLDSRSAHFHLDLNGRPAGEHVLVIRAIDSGNNAGLAKIILP